MSSWCCSFVRQHRLSTPYNLLYPFIIRRYIGPYHKYSYGSVGNDFFNSRLQALNIETGKRYRGQISFWHYKKSWGLITDDLTGEQYKFHHSDIIGKNGFRELLIWRNVEFTAKRASQYRLVAVDVIDLGPSAYLPPKGVTESIDYPVHHLENKAQWDTIPSWYSCIRKGHSPLDYLPPIKPLIYEDAKWKPWKRKY